MMPPGLPRGPWWARRMGWAWQGERYIARLASRHGVGGGASAVGVARGGGGPHAHYQISKVRTRQQPTQWYGPLVPSLKPTNIKLHKATKSVSAEYGCVRLTVPFTAHGFKAVVELVKLYGLDELCHTSLSMNESICEFSFDRLVADVDDINHHTKWWLAAIRLGKWGQSDFWPSAAARGRTTSSIT